MNNQTKVLDHGFLRERLHPHAQYEIRVYAEAIFEELKQIAPVACNAFIKTLGDDYE